jgi:hypothetical protein
MVGQNRRYKGKSEPQGCEIEQVFHTSNLHSNPMRRNRIFRSHQPEGGSGELHPRKGTILERRSQGKGRMTSVLPCEMNY